MSNLICPISAESIDKRAARTGAVLTATVLVAFAITGAWPLIGFVVADYVVRLFTPYRSPLALAGRSVMKAARVAPKPMNKGPKIFAWRMGFMMAVASLVLFPFAPTASAITALGLAAFNVLDGVFNLCVGCVIYTYLVLPYFGPPETNPATI
jgi:hypothetical protein